MTRDKWLYDERLVDKDRGTTGRYRYAGKHKITGEKMIELEYRITSSGLPKEFGHTRGLDMKKIDKQIEDIVKMLFAEHAVMASDKQLLIETLVFQLSSLLSSQRDELVKELEDMPINKHEVHYYIEVEGHKECIKCYAIKQMHILARRYANKP